MVERPKPRPGDEELRAEIAEIERAAKERFEAQGYKLFGLGFKARHAPIKG